MSDIVCIVSYHELGLKGKNRAKFERRLMRNIDFALKGAPVEQSVRLIGRIIIPVINESQAEVIARRVAKIAGVAHTTIAYQVGRSMHEILDVSYKVLKEARPFETFRVSAKRSNTDFEMTSMELNKVVGAYLVEKTNARVKLKGADVDVSVLVVGGHTYISARQYQGIGGLPAGSSNKVISLLSSGIDSPVATWRMLRRGAIGVGLHFSGRPQTASDSEFLVKEIGEVLEKTTGMGRIYIVPFGDIQKDIATKVLPDLRIIMYRRVMFIVAQKVAEIEGAKALVTGESLGQVASQTLENICAVDEVAQLPVLRPLIGSDKIEIMEDARAIGTYDLSIQDAADCCTLFMPRRPETHANLDVVHKAWGLLDVNHYVELCLNNIEYLDFQCREYKAPTRFPSLTSSEK